MDNILRACDVNEAGAIQLTCVLTIDQGQDIDQSK